ncbi:MAG TPA: hypothetical protein VLS44_06040, partial [Nitrospira sp.]|nr:hypothetical protein [Nitrospira sp.]
MFLATLVFAGLMGCDRPPDQTPDAKTPPVTEKQGVLRLTPEELARTAIEVAPVVRGQLHVPREF